MVCIDGRITGPRNWIARLNRVYISSFCYIALKSDLVQLHELLILIVNHQGFRIYIVYIRSESNFRVQFEDKN